MDDQSRSSAPVESLVSRLDQFDLRLRQIEEKQRLLPAPECYFTADVKLLAKKRRGGGGGGGGGQHCRYTSLSAMHDLEIKDALLDRLHMLETRIRQLSSELDKDIGGGGASPAETVVRAEKNKESGGARSWRSVVSFKSGARELPSQKPIIIKVKELEKAVGAAEKAVGAACQTERRRAERARLYRRWLTVGC
ncbi:uncharacterized protein LOC122029453 [Zingiber officinale]|uniref:uncharacterized protein LOC122029453 n=1 Tax=Zingiber officinale TaxID=94328 RepID=UPI001C4BBCF7|nr:uncharacterized protein LOC122029453 [Zingiber officinale]